jgi:hypothetical protein
MFVKKAKFFLMRKITVKSVMDLIVNTKAKMIGKIKIEDTGSILIDKDTKQQHTDELIRNGFTVLDHKISADLVNSIVKYSEQINCYDSYSDSGKPIDHNNPPKETHVAHYNREDLIKFKPIMDLANDSGVLQVVQDFLGAKPTISNINMWWSFGGRKQAEHAQLFHRDMDDWRFCKLFIYLTDVNEKAGPHIYVKSSSQSPKLRKIRRYKDSEIEETFGKENVMKFTEPKGTAFIVDTYGFHKGLLPESENRLLLQVQYSLYPIGIEKYEPLPVDTNTYNPYINRLLIK